MNLAALTSFLIWSGAIAEIGAGLLLALPALRLSRYLLAIEKVAEREPSDPAARRMRELVLEVDRRHGRGWDAKTHRLLQSGLCLFVYGALARLIVLALERA